MSDMKELAAGVGHIPSGLFIVTSTDESGNKDGYLASWVQQVSFSPLMIAIAIKADRPGYESIMSGKPFSVNIVGDHDTQYMRHFWSGYAPGEGPFGEIPHKMSDNGTIMIDGAKSVVECKFVSKAQPGDHEVVFAEVINSHVLNEEAAPKTHVRKNGMDY